MQVWQDRAFVDNGAKASYNVDSITYDNAAAFDIENTGDAAWRKFS